MSQTLSAAEKLTRVVRTVLMADVVEYTRLMQLDEAGTVKRWQTFVDLVVDRFLPGNGGRLVKSLGDGLMIEFPDARAAVRAALAMHGAIGQTHPGIAHEYRLWLRIGIHVSPLITGRHDVYGHGLNLAARLLSLAGAGETVVSADVRDQLTPDIDADLEDLGECHLKHIRKPVRAFRVGPPVDTPIIPITDLASDLRATVAVLPFSVRDVESPHRILGQIVADEVISTLSRSLEINVVSRLSTAALQDRTIALEDIGTRLRANYVLSGSFHVQGDRLSLKAELAETRDGRVAWAGSLKGKVSAILAGEDPLPAQLVDEACAGMMVHELQRAQGQAAQTLENHTLLLAGITLMHRISPQAFRRAHQMLETLIERAPRLAAPHAWLAKWHVLRVTQGWSDDSQADGRAALECARRALDRDAASSLALTVEGQVHTYILKQLDEAEDRYAQALQANPNDALAWLLKGTLHAFRDEGREAVRHTKQAMRLSPMDPLRFYFEALAATAAVSAGQYERGVRLARSSLRLNRTHGSTLRTLIIALWHLGAADEARAVTRELMRQAPSFRVEDFVRRSPSSGYENGRLAAQALALAGVPD
jgi:adenylate cyclase